MTHLRQESKKNWGVNLLVLEKKRFENLVFLEALVMLGEIDFIAITK